MLWKVQLTVRKFEGLCVKFQQDTIILMMIKGMTV